ncbi:MAG: histidinol-phosphatase [Rhodobacteraceae bacterium]|nr:histidinol-phosphatase [Paracoccaceae bacterium]
MTITETEQLELLSVAHELADVARVETLKYFRTSGLSVSNKEQDSFDPVTEADRASERAMRDILAKRRPNDGILGEEYGTQEGTSGLTWVLDPIDGTRAYISGTASWGVLIGLDAGNGPVLGIVDQPFTGERFLGGFGQSIWIRGTESRQMKTRDCARLADAILYTTFPEVGTEAEGAAFKRVSKKCKLTRYGLDCYAYALIGLGMVDMVIESGLLAYDVQGPIAVVEAAGGIVTNWQGGPAHNGGQIIAAGDARIHAQALEILSKVS